VKGKKAPPAYLANVDFLIAHNPILAILETWTNNNPGAGVNLLSQAFTVTLGVAEYAISDPEFLAIIAVTVAEDYDVNFDDYGGTPQHLTGSFEVPLVNSFILGPDPSQPPATRRQPYTYRWNPDYGPTIYLESAEEGLGPLWNKVLTVHYAVVAPVNQASAGKSKKNTKGAATAPLGRVALTYEDELGNGPEFNDFESKRIVYPMFAGAGSDSYNCGPSGTIDKVNVEVLGKFALYPSGDADFADMIEDICKSGPLQAGYGSSLSLSGLQHGVNCYDYPLVVQARYAGALEDVAGLGVHPISLGQPLQAGDVILFMRLGRDGNTFVTPSDGVNTYNTIATGTVAPGGTGLLAWPYQLYRAVVATDQPAGLVIDPGDHNYNDQVMIAVLRGDGLVFDNATIAVGTPSDTAQIDASITTTQDGGKDAVIVMFQAQYPGTFAYSAFSDWKSLFNDPVAQYNAFSLIRRVTQPGTYSISGVKLLGGGNYVTVLMSFKSTEPRRVAASLGNIIDDESLDLVRRQCRAYGLWGSLVMASQQAALEWLKLFGDAGADQNGGFAGAANMAYFWSGFRLKFFPYAEASKVGNGAIYISPTAAGPIADLDIAKGDFKWATDQMPVTVERTPQAEDAPNIFQFQIPCRASSYNQVVISQPLAGATARFGPRKESPKALDCVVDPTIARKLLMVRARRATLDRNRYPVTIDARWQLFEPGDLITITDEDMGIVRMPVRFASLEEDPKTLDFKCIMSRFIYGMCSPDAIVGSDPIGSGGDHGGDPGSVNIPIFFQPVPRLMKYGNQPQLWIVVSGGAQYGSPLVTPDYGGCEVLVSTDGGASYHAVGIIIGNSVTGWLTADWPAAADPDTTNDLFVDVSESRGVVPQHPVSDEDNFIYPLWVDGGTAAVPYELGAWSVATLGTPYCYTLKATGGGTNHLRRAVYGAPQDGTGVDHPTSPASRFCVLNAAGQGMVKLDIDATWIGKTIYFKFPTFNPFYSHNQSWDDAVAYPYTVIQGSEIELFTVNGG
jgi:Putative phage tail protein